VIDFIFLKNKKTGLTTKVPDKLWLTFLKLYLGCYFLIPYAINFSLRHFLTRVTSTIVNNIIFI